MVEASFIEPAVAQRARALPLQVESAVLDKTEAPYFVDLVRAQLKKGHEQNLSIFTSLDLHLQDLAQQALRNGLNNVEKLFRSKRAQPVQGCLIALEPRTGAVVALVGGRSYGASQFNRVIRAQRQPGSIFKPFVYLTAFEATFNNPDLPPITPATVIEDTASLFLFEGKEYIPQNYGDEYHGYVTLRRALAMSLNIPTVKVAQMVGYDQVAHLWTKKLGFGDHIRPYPAIALGSFETTPFEMAMAYSILANGGKKLDPITVLKITDAKGQPQDRPRVKAPQRVVGKESAFLVTHMLRSVLNEGTAGAARKWGFTLDAAGKTGTTNDMRDAWFAGYTPELLCVVWVGFDDNSPLNLSGAKAALPIWTEFMRGALTGQKSSSFAPPSGNVVFVDIDKETGLLAGPTCPQLYSEAFIAGTEPREPCFYHSDGVLDGDTPPE